ncbi:MAG: hypothetical protein ACAI38_11605 [Myxococcota bacterium]|nr:hypothetical protein [Myxococcota bacterium]
MATWLDMTIVGVALALAAALVRHVYQRGKACAKACGACGPPQSDLVQIGRKDRPFLAGSRANR